MKREADAIRRSESDHTDDGNGAPTEALPVYRSSVSLQPISIVVPVHNEAPILTSSLTRLREELTIRGIDFELLLCENGSSDETLVLARELASRYPQIRIQESPVADYGTALKEGIKLCRHEIVVLFNIEFWDVGFVETAAGLLFNCDVVTGSKVMEGARDRRPMFRRAITRGFNLFLRMAYGFKGTDTHGLKAFWRTRVSEIAASCVTNSWIFDTELILRCERRGLRIVEVPVPVHELRQPSYHSILRRVPRTLWNLLVLKRALG